MRRITACDDMARLTRSAERLVRLAQAINERTQDWSNLPAAPGHDLSVTPCNTAADATGPHVQAARELIQAHRNQPDFGAPALFQNRLWLLILDLFIADSKQADVAVKAACLSLGGSQTTSLRCILDLERLGIVESRADVSDGRRRLLSLSATARQTLQDYLARHGETRGKAVRLSMRMTTHQFDENEQMVNEDTRNSAVIDARMDRSATGCETLS